MTELRQRMLEALRLRGLAPRTQEAYVRAVRQLAAHCHKPPDQISEEELRQYFLHLSDVKQVSRSTCTIALTGIKFFYQHTLRRAGRSSIWCGRRKRRNCPWCSAWARCSA